MSKNSLPIETERLLIRPFTLEDIAPAYIMNLDPDVNEFTGDGGIVSRAEIERRITEDVLGDYAKYGFGRWAVVWKETGQFIGFVGFKYLSDIDEVDIGYRFMKAYWGKGIATEAGKACLSIGFSDLKLNRIIAWVLPENKASIRVLEKLGFRFEKEVMEDGLFVQQYCLEKGII